MNAVRSIVAGVHVVGRAAKLLVGGCLLLGLTGGAQGANPRVNEPDYFVEWVGFARTKGGPYIDTRYAFTKMPLVEIGVAELSCGDNDFLGTASAGAGGFVIDVCQNGTGYFYRYGTGTASSTPVGTGPYSLNTPTFNDVVWGKDICYNGERVAYYGVEVSDETFAYNTQTFYLFRGRTLFSGTAKVSYLRMYNGTNRTELVRDFRPGVKDGAAGFYDAVEDKFYVNEGTGDFDCSDRLAEDATTVLVDTNWLKFSKPNPPYGTVRGLAAGESRSFVVPDAKCTDYGELALCAGWNLYKFDTASGKFADEPYLTGTGTTCAYTHPDPAEFVRLEWVWLSDPSSVKTRKAGEWDDPEVWSSRQVPTKDSQVYVLHDLHCSGDVFAKSLNVCDAALRFHASPDHSIAQSTPDKETGDGKRFTFDVAGDLLLDNGSLALHGGRSTPSITNLNLSVGGDLILSGASELCVAAAAYDGEDCSLTNLYNTATRLKIGGALELSDTAVLYTVCDQKVGSPVRIDCASFALGASARVNADESGWHWLAEAKDGRRAFKTGERSMYTFAYGPGHDSSRTGGGYGGGGSNDGIVTAPGYGAAYGYAYAPYLPGSPSGGDSGWTLDYGSLGGQCRGGGVFWLVAKGTVTLEGRISATVPRVGWQAASGGSVWIAADDFVVGDQASVDVSGGDAGASTPTAAGGGGRVSFAKRVSEADLAALARGEKPEGYLYTDELKIMSVDVSGGTSTASDAAQPGTATFVMPAAATHVLTIDGDPVLATEVKPRYGAHPLEEGTVQTFSAPVYGIDPEDARRRHRCLGYVVSNETAEVDARADVQGELTVGSTDLTLTWRWDETEYPAYLDVSGSGHLELFGETHGSATTAYIKASEANVLTAVPDAGHEFLCWFGEVDEADRCNPALPLDARRQQHVKAVFRVAGAVGTRVWRSGVTGGFADAANWEDGIVPGVADAIVVTSGTCLIPDYVRCASLTVSGDGKVVSERQQQTDDVYVTCGLRVTGDVRLSDEAVLQLGATDGTSQIYNTLEVDGNLVLEDSSALHVAAGRRTGVHTWETGCGFVRVGGSFILKDTSAFLPNCDGYYGGGVTTTVGGLFAVAVGARVDADGRGMGEYDVLGWNTGVGDHGSRAPCHFGQGTSYGSEVHTPQGKTYDNAFVPLMPGQQNREGNTRICRGGGVVRIFAGMMRIDGTVTANGLSCDGGNTSGGSIWLVSQNALSFGASSVLSAQGAYSDTWPTMGASGGGCVAVYSYFTPEMVEWLTAHSGNPLGAVASEDRPPKRIREWADELLAQHPTFADAAAPGSAARDLPACWGSFRALRGPGGGMMLIVR